MSSFDPHDSSGRAKITVDSLLEECLNRLPEDWSDAVEQAALDHPELADALRKRFQRLEETGLVSPVEPQPEAEGNQFGPFELQRFLGSGGMGEVYLARKSGDQVERSIALKIMRPEFRHGTKAQQRFEREIRMASRLRHPGICEIYEAGAVDGVSFIAMRYLEGPTLAEFLEEAREESKPASPKVLLDWFIRLADTVEEAHAAGMIHRDLKPENIILVDRQEPKILDFGLAIDLDDDEVSLTQTGALLGTPLYLAPEAIQGGGDPDPRLDVYALGVCLYESLAGRPPFHGATRDQLYQHILKGEPDPLRRHRPELSSDLQWVVRTAMALEPSRRYLSAKAFAADLRRVRSGLRPNAKRPSVILRATRWLRKQKWASAFFLVLLLALILTGYLVKRLLDDLRHVRALNLAGQAAVVTPSDPRRGLALALEAVSTEPIEPTWSRLYQALAEVRDGALFEGHSRDVWFSEFCSDQKHVLTASPDGEARLWDLSGSVIQTFRHPSAVTTATLDTRSKRVLTGDSEGTVKVWGPSIDGWQERAQFRLGSSITYLVSTRTGFLAGTGEGLFAQEEGKPPACVHASPVHALGTLKTGESLAVLEEGMVLLLSATGESQFLSLYGAEANPGEVLLAHFEEPNLAVAYRDGLEGKVHLARFHLNDFRELKKVREEPLSSVPQRLRVGPVHDLVVLVDGSGQAWVYRENADPILLRGHGSLIHEIAVSHRGDRVATAAGDGRGRLFDDHGRLLAAFRGHRGHLIDIDFSSDDQWVLTASQDRSARTWSVVPSAVPRLQGTFVSFNRGDQLWTYGPDRWARRWDHDGLRAERLFQHPIDLIDGQWMRSTQVGEGGLFCALESGGLGLWLDESGSVVDRIPEQAECVFDATPTAWLGRVQQETLLLTKSARSSPWRRVRLETSFNPVCGGLLDSEAHGMAVLLAGHEGHVAWFETPQSLPVVVRPHHTRVRSVAFSPDGTYAITGSRDNSAVLWPLRNFEDAIRLDGHSGTVTHAFFSTSESWEPIVTCSADKTVRLWDRQGKLSTILRGHEGIVERGTMSADGLSLLSVGFDHDVRLWRVDTKAILRLAERYASER